MCGAGGVRRGLGSKRTLCLRSLKKGCPLGGTAAISTMSYRPLPGKQPNAQPSLSPEETAKRKRLAHLFWTKHTFYAQGTAGL